MEGEPGQDSEKMVFKLESERREAESWAEWENRERGPPRGRCVVRCSKA